MESPKHLRPLLDGTPLAVERIKLAWPGLSISDRAHLITVLLADRLKEGKALRWSHHCGELIDLALTDDNAYIRYLAAKSVSAPSTPKEGSETSRYLVEKTSYEKVQSDPVILVRLAFEEQGGFKFLMRELDDPESFWKRPQIERLALVNGVKEDGEKIAKLLRYATKTLLPGNAEMELEMFDVLLQYLGGKTIAERVADSENYARRFYDGSAEYSAGKSIGALWGLVPKVPKSLAHVLIESLPEKAGFQTGISPHVIDALDEEQLKHLLWREDVELRELRRKLYKESSNDSLRKAAVRGHGFNLLDSDISDLVYDPNEPKESGERKVGELAMLADSCQGATLVQMQAICNLINDAPTDFRDFGSFAAIGTGEMFQTERAKRLSPSTLQYEVLAMRLFALAKELAPIKSGEKPRELPETLIKHQDLIVLRNPWQTYLNLRKVVRLDRWKQTIGYLPGVYIQDFDLPDEPSEDADDDDDQERRQLFDLMNNVQSQVTDMSEKDIAERSALSKALSTLSAQIESVESVRGRRIEVIQTQIEKLTSNFYILLLVVVAILLFMIFK